jgi:hypothetical protein
MLKTVCRPDDANDPDDGRRGRDELPLAVYRHQRRLYRPRDRIRVSPSRLLILISQG